MKVLEFFSGIGGMHYALQAAEMQADVTAVEINTIANDVYRFNFPLSKLLQKNILSIRPEDLNSIRPEMLLMSPPCQPFTRVGLRKDLKDIRTDPLKHILSLLHDLPSLNYVLVENVKGFEESEARKKLITCLEDLHFNIREHLISPIQLGVPNMRTRYYLLAKRRPLQFCYESHGMMEQLPERVLKIMDTLKNQFPDLKLIEDVLQITDISNKIYQEHLIPESVLKTRANVMDIVTPKHASSCCFTKAYGCYAKGTGSVFCPYDQMTIEEAFRTSSFRELNLRYFTSKEVARLMSFPEHFTFPQHATRKQKYRLLGNSVNVKVVAFLIRLMLT